MSKTSLPILVADDSADDIFLLERALEKSAIHIPLKHVKDGEEAIQYLAGEEQFADRAAYPFPGLMLLDLKMPKVNGFEVLEWRQARAALAALPVIVWTSSTAPSDLNRAQEMGADSYLIKPASANGYLEIAEALRARWVQVKPSADRPSA